MGELNRRKMEISRALEGKPTEVDVGDLVIIPAGTSQRIINIGKTEIVFHCICIPPDSRPTVITRARRYLVFERSTCPLTLHLMKRQC